MQYHGALICSQSNDARFSCIDYIGDLVALGNTRGAIFFYRVVSKATRSRTELALHVAPPANDKTLSVTLTCIRFSPCQSYLAVGTISGTVLVFSLKDKIRLDIKSHHDDHRGKAISALCWSHDSTKLFSGCIAGVVIEFLFSEAHSDWTSKSTSTSAMALNFASALLLGKKNTTVICQSNEIIRQIECTYSESCSCGQADILLVSVGNHSMLFQLPIKKHIAPRFCDIPFQGISLTETDEKLLDSENFENDAHFSELWCASCFSTFDTFERDHGTNRENIQQSGIIIARSSGTGIELIYSSLDGDLLRTFKLKGPYRVHGSDDSWDSCCLGVRCLTSFGGASHNHLMTLITADNCVMLINLHDMSCDYLLTHFDYSVHAAVSYGGKLFVLYEVVQEEMMMTDLLECVTPSSATAPIEIFDSHLHLIFGFMKKNWLERRRFRELDRINQWPDTLPSVSTSPHSAESCNGYLYYEPDPYYELIASSTVSAKDSGPKNSKSCSKLFVRTASDIERSRLAQDVAVRKRMDNLEDDLNHALTDCDEFLEAWAFSAKNGSSLTDIISDTCECCCNQATKELGGGGGGERSLDEIVKHGAILGSSRGMCLSDEAINQLSSLQHVLTAIDTDGMLLLPGHDTSASMGYDLYGLEDQDSQRRLALAAACRARAKGRRKHLKNIVAEISTVDDIMLPASPSNAEDMSATPQYGGSPLSTPAPVLAPVAPSVSVIVPSAAPSSSTTSDSSVLASSTATNNGGSSIASPYSSSKERAASLDTFESSSTNGGNNSCSSSSSLKCPSNDNVCEAARFYRSLATIRLVDSAIQSTILVLEYPSVPVDDYGGFSRDTDTACSSAPRSPTPKREYKEIIAVDDIPTQCTSFPWVLLEQTDRLIAHTAHVIERFEAVLASESSSSTIEGGECSNMDCCTRAGRRCNSILKDSPTVTNALDNLSTQRSLSFIASATPFVPQSVIISASAPSHMITVAEEKHCCPDNLRGKGISTTEINNNNKNNVNSSVSRRESDSNLVTSVADSEEESLNVLECTDGPSSFNQTMTVVQMSTEPDNCARVAVADVIFPTPPPPQPSSPPLPSQSPSFCPPLQASSLSTPSPPTSSSKASSSPIENSSSPDASLEASDRGALSTPNRRISSSSQIVKCDSTRTESALSVCATEEDCGPSPFIDSDTSWIEWWWDLDKIDIRADAAQTDIQKESERPGISLKNRIATARIGRKRRKMLVAANLLNSIHDSENRVSSRRMLPRTVVVRDTVQSLATLRQDETARNMYDVTIIAPRGLGLNLALLPDGALVIRTFNPLADSQPGPIEKTGLVKPGDFLLGLNGLSLIGLGLEQIANILQNIDAMGEVRTYEPCCLPFHHVMFPFVDLTLNLSFLSIAVILSHLYSTSVLHFLCPILPSPILSYFVLSCPVLSCCL